MSDSLQTSPASSISYLLRAKSPSCFPNPKLIGANYWSANIVSIFSIKTHSGGEKFEALAKYDEEGSVHSFHDSPASIDLLPISTEDQFDRAVSHEAVVVLWMASWCRKCIFLKPKLEKLAADYNPSLRFYSVDVNNVPHKLVVRAGVTKMPTIQLWKDGKKQGEVIGGHKAHLVVNEVREMIESESNSW
ncbi:unnamed protein product [Cuscuta epithymum]|uniref:Thioredoxin domain-containing protein n=1 Tax=Cuscuta epithymum TaxID=186058 RepID=A0AAV0BXH9_9ASTE|nr:unnamed protein product [Cuscuta epithymum]CAH9135962.1 unnamed protein product [Cuscuta epithymum]